MPVTGTLVLVLGAALATAAVFGVSRVLPSERRERHNTVLGVVYGEIGVIYAVVLAMVVVGVWDTRARAHDNTYTETNALLQISWYGRSLPEPQHGELRRLNEAYTTVVIREEWPRLSRQQASPTAWALFTELRDYVSTRTPSTAAEQARYQVALEAVAQLGDARRERVNEAANAGVPPLLWAALLVGAFVTIGFGCMFGMTSLRIHCFVVFCLALTVGFMLLIVYEFNYPFGGAMKVEPTAFELALDRMHVVG
ncbi:hypothetical protein ACFWBN_02870 [Streptomyces sp. NPDC059989]|uniref:bestrophin-like domain n=1 Tax=Streptomyces sp. NPDC059989 TaxID=3347026 RepID=UPI0036D0FAFE